MIINQLLPRIHIYITKIFLLDTAVATPKHIQQTIIYMHLNYTTVANRNMNEVQFKAAYILKHILVLLIGYLIVSDIGYLSKHII